MSAVLYFSIFVLVVVIIVALMAQLAYKQQRMTRSEARFRQFFVLSACILSVLFAIIAAYFHISIWFVLLGFLGLILILIVIGGIIVYFSIRRK